VLSLLTVVVSEMTYTVSSGTLNSTILYHQVEYSEHARSPDGVRSSGRQTNWATANWATTSGRLGDTSRVIWATRYRNGLTEIAGQDNDGQTSRA